MKKVLLSTIAKECSLSVSTVSRVISGDSSRRIKDETRSLVLRKAEELGYFREHIRRLNAASSIRAAVLFLSDHESLMSPFFSQIIDGIKEEAERNETADVDLSVLSLYDSHFFSRFSEGQYDVAIILGRVRKDVLDRVRCAKTQLIYTGLNSIEDMDEVICDAREGMKTAVEHLHSLGHSEIAFIGPVRQEDLKNEFRFDGYLSGLEQCGLSFDPRLVEDSYLSAEDGYEKAGKLFRRKTPEAVICANDNLAVGVMKFLQDRGFRIPQDVSVTGFDNIEEAAYLKPSLTTIDVPKRELGRFALRLALERRQSGRKYNVKLSLPFTFVERESTKETTDA